MKRYGFFGPMGVPEVSRRLDCRLGALEDELRRVLQLIHRKKGPRSFHAVTAPLGAAQAQVRAARRAYVVPLVPERGRP